MRRHLTLIAAALVAACSSSEFDPNRSKEPSPAELKRRMVEFATPGPEHKRLDPLVGKFKVTIHTWEAPGLKEEVTEATSTGEWILGGRFVQERFEGSLSGAPFSGVSLTGYDNFAARYQSLWFDTSGTMILPPSEGTLDSTGKVITSSRRFVDPATGTPVASRELLTIFDVNHHTFEWFQPGPDGKELRTMKLDYVRIPGPERATRATN